MTGKTVYRGVEIEREESVQMGHRTEGGGLRKQLGIGTKRKAVTYRIHWPEPLGGGTSAADTLREAKKRVDDRIGE